MVLAGGLLLRPHVVSQSDYLLRIAHELGFDAETVWNDPKNVQQRQDGNLSQDPNILKATDILYVPDPAPPVTFSLVTGATNTFTAPCPPSVTITHQFLGDDDTPKAYASRGYTIKELSDLTGLTTDGKGVVTFKAPVTLQTATLVFSDTGESWVLVIGDLDPIDTLRGIFQRLQHLGYVDASAAFEQNVLPLRAALNLFKKYPPPGLDASPAAPADSSSTTDAAPDPSGLADDGTLDAKTTDLLRKAYGC
jgi:hypothetical protein